MVTSLIRPSYQNNFYSPQRGGIPLNPNLWKGLVGYWPTSLGVTGDRLVDVSGFGNSGVLTNAPTWGIVKGWQSLNYGGSAGEHVFIEDAPQYNMPGAFTIGAWATTGVLDSSRRIYYRWNTHGIFLGQGTAGPGAWSLTVFTSTGNSTVNSDSPQILNTRQFIVGVRQSDGTLLLYVDGVLQSNTAFRVGAISIIEPTYIGLSRGLSAEWEDEIGDIFLYNRELMHSEIMQYQVDPHALFRTRRIIGRAPVVTGVDVRKHIIQAYMRMCA